MDSNFEPQDGFFQLFSDPHSTRLTRVQLREDFVRDRDLEAIGKQVGHCGGRLVWSQFCLCFIAPVDHRSWLDSTNRSESRL